MKDNKIVIKNLTDRITEEECKMMCETFGKVYMLSMMSRYGSYTCEVVFIAKESASKACADLDGRLIDGVNIEVQPKDESIPGYGYGYGYGKPSSSRGYGEPVRNYTGYGYGYGGQTSPKYEPHSPSPNYEPHSPSPKYEPHSPKNEPHSQKTPEYKSPSYAPHSAAEDPPEVPPNFGNPTKPSYLVSPRSSSPDYGPPKSTDYGVGTDPKTPPVQPNYGVGTDPKTSPVQPNYGVGTDLSDVYPKFALRSASPIDRYLPGATSKFTPEPEGPSPLEDYLPKRQPSPADPACERPTGGQVEPTYHNNSPQNPGLRPTVFEPRSPDETPPDDETASQSGAGLEEIELFPETTLDESNSMDLNLDLNEVEI